MNFAGKANSGWKTLLASQFLNIIIGAVAFFCTCITLHCLLPAPDASGIATKMRFFAAHKDDFDTIFVGSSHIYCGVSPALFDEGMAKAGIPSHTFNFGVNGMYPPERFYVLEQILSLNPRKLKRVFVELDDIQGTWLPDEQNSQRVLYWRDWRHTWVILEKALDLDVPGQWKRKLWALRKRRDTIIRSLSLFAKNVSNFGRALDIAESFVNSNQIPEVETDGYFAQTTRIFGEKESAFQNELAREQAAHIANVVLDPYASRFYVHFARRIRSTGAIPVFVVTPTYPQMPSRFSGPPPGLVLSYNNPLTYSDLYRSDARSDEGHLNSTGAERLTRLLVEDFLRNTPQP